MRIKDAEKRENRSVVFVSSTTGTHGNTGQLNYSAAKAGTYYFTNITFVNLLLHKHKHPNPNNISGYTDAILTLTFT